VEFVQDHVLELDHIVRNVCGEQEAISAGGGGGGVLVASHHGFVGRHGPLLPPQTVPPNSLH